jgi:hypothetical protein
MNSPGSGRARRAGTPEASLWRFRGLCATTRLPNGAGLFYRPRELAGADWRSDVASGSTLMNLVRQRFLALALLLLPVAGCATHYIANTDVEETDFNREIIEFCEKYRHAVEYRNVPVLLQMAHENYYEDGGTIDTADDIDRAGLAEYLEGRFKETTGIRYEIRYRAVSPGRRGSFFVDFTYSASYKIPTSEGEAWRRRVADDRLELVRDGESFKILSGM